MSISVTEFKSHCLEILREVERKGRPIEISKQGKVRFRVIPVVSPGVKAWESLRASGRLDATPEESVLSEREFNANQ